jgi:hypothetical protein
MALPDRKLAAYRCLLLRPRPAPSGLADSSASPANPVLSPALEDDAAPRNRTRRAPVPGVLSLSATHALFRPASSTLPSVLLSLAGAVTQASSFRRLRVDALTFMFAGSRTLSLVASLVADASKRSGSAADLHLHLRSKSEAQTPIQAQEQARVQARFQAKVIGVPAHVRSELQLQSRPQVRAGSQAQVGVPQQTKAKVHKRAQEPDLEQTWQQPSEQEREQGREQDREQDRELKRAYEQERGLRREMEQEQHQEEKEEQEQELVEMHAHLRKHARACARAHELAPLPLATNRIPPEQSVPLRTAPRSPAYRMLPTLPKLDAGVVSAPKRSLPSIPNQVIQHDQQNKLAYGQQLLHQDDGVRMVIFAAVVFLSSIAVVLFVVVAHIAHLGRRIDLLASTACI